MTSDEEDWVALVGLQHQLLLGCLQGFLQVRDATITSVPSLTRVERRSGSCLEAAASAGKIRTRLTPWVRASRQALSLGSMPPGETTIAFSSAGIWSSESQRMTFAVSTFDAGDVGEEDQRVGLGADGAGRGHLVGVDVVVLTVEAERDRGDDGHCAHLPDGFEPAWIGGGDLTDKAEVGYGLLLAGAEDMAIAAGEADGLTGRADRVWRRATC